VTDRRGTTEIPTSIDAWLRLAADGELIASDDVNTITGHRTGMDLPAVRAQMRLHR
jgi:hypothetical protein